MSSINGVNKGNIESRAEIRARAAVLPVFLMFAAALLCAVVSAALCCSDINSRAEVNFNIRTAVNYTSNKLRSGVRVRFESGAAAVYDGAGVSYIYSDGEKLMELYTSEDDAAASDAFISGGLSGGESICGCRFFTVTKDGETAVLTFGFDNQTINCEVRLND